jgi:hypothetical protein
LHGEIRLLPELAPVSVPVSELELLLSSPPPHPTANIAMSNVRRAAPKPAFTLRRRVLRAQPLRQPAQLVDHLLTEDRAFRRMMQQVQADKSGEQTSLYHRNPITESDNGGRRYYNFQV